MMEAKNFPEYIKGIWFKTALFVSVFFLFPTFSFAATLQFTPSSSSFNLGQTFNIRVEVNPDGESVNAVESAISFDASKLSVSAISKTGSAFSLWTTEPEFSNTAGTISFGGGSPTPFSRASTLVTITFEATGLGAATVSFDEGSVLAADGQGTDVLETMRESVYTITPAAEPPPTPTPVGNTPVAPVIESPSHPEEESWYPENTGEFLWDIPSGVTGVRLLMDQEPDSAPSIPYTPPIDRRIIDGLQDGIHYFHVQFQNSSGWGEITHRKVQVDTTPPEDFEAIVIEGVSSTSPPSLSFATVDETSGIERYEVIIQDDPPVVLTPEELAELPNSAYTMPLLFDGTYLVTIRVFDFAGNVTETNVSVLMATGLVQESESSAPTVVVPDEGIDWKLVIIVFLLIAFLLLGMLFFIQRKRLLKERDYLRRETREIRERMEKIFSVLQDELEEQINSLDSKPRLSASEKRVLASLREALEVSEAFINKEIEDVEKILR